MEKAFQSSQPIEVLSKSDWKSEKKTFLGCQNCLQVNAYVHEQLLNCEQESEIAKKALTRRWVT